MPEHLQKSDLEICRTRPTLLIAKVHRFSKEPKNTSTKVITKTMLKFVKLWANNHWTNSYKVEFRRKVKKPLTKNICLITKIELSPCRAVSNPWCDSSWAINVIIFLNFVTIVSSFHLAIETVWPKLRQTCPSNISHFYYFIRYYFLCNFAFYEIFIYFKNLIWMYIGM